MTEPGGQTRSRTGLLLAGGGARGAYQVGVLKAIAELWGNETNPFPVICGVSVGSINAVYIASMAERFGVGVAELERMWRDLRTEQVYRTDVATVTTTALHWLSTLTVGGFGKGNPLSLLRNGPLGDLIRRNIDFESVNRCLTTGVLDALAITASSYASGRAMTFFQAPAGLPDWQRARRDGVHCEITAEHILASAALPVIFPPQKVDGEYFGDGSLRLTAPLSPAIHLGAERILVVGTRDRRVEQEQVQARRQRLPTLGDIAGHMMDLLFNDNLNEDVERLRRINHTLSLLAPGKASESPLRPVEVLIVQPSQDIGDIARRHAMEIPWTIRGLLRGAGAWGAGWRVPSYLLFEPGFCGELIDLGYQDAMMRKGEIANFLGVP
ncbi:patatin-like phospholipase family protein [Emcibacter sp. SYSU 3D8]|uniref:patatin-like phospholipase family protein n=1 Tax=Emcibacter sp. SYSU 3D8 TaxID=3133969 RepID=UPI0031FEFDEB